MLIIAPELFEAPLQPLVEHKNNTGVATHLITLEAIEANPAFTGVDQAERIKTAIQFFEQTEGIGYVLLVGDVDQFPVRYATQCMKNDPARVNFYFAADLYYADLYHDDLTPSTWDFDGDGRYAEHLTSNDWALDPFAVNLDRLDLHPDVAVGRVPASTADEVDAYVAKVIQYEYWTAHDPSDWFHNVLMISGENRFDTCDPAIHFYEIQSNLGSEFTYRFFVHRTDWSSVPGEPSRPCFQTGTEALSNALERTGLTLDELDFIEHPVSTWADQNTLRVPSAEFEAIGFFAWHDHTLRVAAYTDPVANAGRYTIAFPDGCGDGAFAGSEMGRFGRSFKDPPQPYRTLDGRSFLAVMTSTNVAGTAYRYVTEFLIDETNVVSLANITDYYPDLVVRTDLLAGVWSNRTKGIYLVNPPPPALLQPTALDVDWHPERKLFERQLIDTNSWDRTPLNIRESGWIASVGSTMQGRFPVNGEMMATFFRSYTDPHPRAPPTQRLGDMWRSMLEYWLDRGFDAEGQFDFSGLFARYQIDASEFIKPYCRLMVESTVKYVLFGDPSLRVGGIQIGATDTMPPTTTTTVPDDWTPESQFSLDTTDHGSPPCGVRFTYCSVDGGPFELSSTFVVPDGETSIDYFSVDFLNNTEAVQQVTARVDHTPPVTTLLLDGERPAITTCDDCLSDGCYVDTVTITLNAADSQSEVAHIWYDLGTGWPYTPYDAPFMLTGADLLHPVTLTYWAEDRVGNLEDPQQARFCISNARLGDLRDEIELLAGLRGLLDLRMRQSLVDSLPDIQQVEWSVADATQPSVWKSIGIDQDRRDGWSMPWDTTVLNDGSYLIQMVATGAPPIAFRNRNGAGPVLYSQILETTVNNLPDDAIRLGLSCPPYADPGDTVLYALDFINRTDRDLSNLNVLCVTERDTFSGFEVLDGGKLDPDGYPTWNIRDLAKGATWHGRWRGTTKGRLPPGHAIHSQARATGDGIGLLLSDDPTTSSSADRTTLRISLLPGEIYGALLEQRYRTPVAGLVTLDGPVSRQAWSNKDGDYQFSGLPSGKYSLSVEAESYAYQTPPDYVAISVDGKGTAVRQDFLLSARDQTPPTAHVLTAPKDLVLGTVDWIEGSARDPLPGAGIQMVWLSIQRLRDRRFWDGKAWVRLPQWLPAKGTTAWKYLAAEIDWTGLDTYVYAARAEDLEGNMGPADVRSTRLRLPAPRLLEPPDQSVLTVTPILRWSHVDQCEYDIQIDDDAEFTSPEWQGSAYRDTVAFLGNLPNGLWYWRVRARDIVQGSPETDWSDVRSFELALEPIQILSLEKHPRDLSLELQWTTSSGRLYRIMKLNDLRSLTRYRSDAPAVRAIGPVTTSTSAPPVEAEGFYRIQEESPF